MIQSDYKNILSYHVPFHCVLSSDRLGCENSSTGTDYKIDSGDGLSKSDTAAHAPRCVRSTELKAGCSKVGPVFVYCSFRKRFLCCIGYTASNVYI